MTIATFIVSYVHRDATQNASTTHISRNYTIVDTKECVTSRSLVKNFFSIESKEVASNLVA